MDVERLIALAIALEALFSPADKGEFTFRISQSAAQFLARTPTEREEIFSQVREMYGRRSALFHGAYNVSKYDKGEFVTAEEVEVWASIIRRALLGFFVLYLRGEQDRQAVLDKIQSAAFDASIGDKVRADSDIEAFLLAYRSG